jgi:hypothetical protein
MYLSRFELKLIHQSAKKEKLAHSIMLIPNTLSRGSRIEVGNDNKNQVMLPKKMFVNELIIKDNLQQELAQATSDSKITDEYFVTIWKILKKYPKYK